MDTTNPFNKEYTMTLSEDLKALSENINKAKTAQVVRIAEVTAETQADIDAPLNELNELTMETVKRYHKFKFDLWNSGETIGLDPMWHIKHVNTDSLVLDSIYEPYQNLVFKDTSHESQFYFAVPLAYFDDAGRWEKGFLEWVEGIHTMLNNAPNAFEKSMSLHTEETGAVTNDYVYKASTVGLPYPGKYFTLQKKIVGTLLDSYLVDYETGNVYYGNKFQIEDGRVKPFACLR